MPQQPGEEENFGELRRGWCLGSAEFRQDLLDRFGECEGEHHSGEISRENSQARAERIIADTWPPRAGKPPI